MMQVASEMVDHQTSSPGVVIMPPACLPVMQFAIVSVNDIVLHTVWSIPFTFVYVPDPYARSVNNLRQKLLTKF